MDKLTTNKRAMYAADTAPFILVFGIVLNILMILFMIIVYSYASDTAEIPEGLERYAFVQRFSNSGECFAYTDGSRAYPGILDWSKFSDESKTDIMKRCFNVDQSGSEKKILSFRLTLEIDENTKQSVTTPNWGSNFGLQEREAKNVLVYHDSKLKPAKLYIEVWNV